jgi:hypothetical protein
MGKRDPDDDFSAEVGKLVDTVQQADNATSREAHDAVRAQADTASATLKETRI